MKSCPGLMHCGVVYCGRLHERHYVFISGHSLEIPSQTLSELSKSLSIVAKEVTGAVYDL